MKQKKEGHQPATLGNKKGCVVLKSEERPGTRRLEHVVNINWVKIAVIAVVSCLCVKYSDTVFHLVRVIVGTMKPLFYGFVIAYVLNIFMKRLEKWYFPGHADGWAQRTRRPVCVFGSILLVLVIAVFLVIMVVPALSESIQVLTKDIPKVFQQFQAWLIKVLADTPELQDYVEGLKIDWNELFGKIGKFLSDGLNSLLTSTFSVVNVLASFVFTGVISVIFAIYMLFGKERLHEQIDKLTRVYAPERGRGTVIRFLRLAHETFTSFIIGQITEAFILGGLCAGGMAILQLPYAMMTGVVVGTTALIPVVGAYIGAIVGAFLIVTVSPLQAVEFLIYLAILQQVEGNIIYPRTVGGSIGLPGIWVLAAVTIGGGLLGIPGMLFGVPLAATLYKWIREDVHRRLAEDEEQALEGTKG